MFNGCHGRGVGRYRLPSESEWEYATRAGGNGRYSFGDSEGMLCAYGNVADRTAQQRFNNWTVASCDDGELYTAPVGGYRPNQFGLHDMHGNVWEWTEDCDYDSYAGAPSDGAAWTTGDCAQRVNRGGSWYNGPRNPRSSGRNRGTTDFRYDTLGFRLLQDRPTAATATSPVPAPFAPISGSEPTEALPKPPAEVADIPDVRVGDTYLVDSQYPNNATLNNMTERKVVEVIDGGVTVASRNVKSRGGQSRTLRYTQEWNLVSSRNADGSGLDYLPPLKYFEFPLYPGKSWRQTSRETNVKTGATRDFTLSATVGEWENISVPAGTFRAIKITSQTEIVDRVSGQRSTGTDVSWYAPDIRRSVRSVITSRNMQGDVEDQFIHVAQYQVSRPSSAQQSSVSQEIPNVQLPDTSKENLQEEDNIAQVLSLAEEQVLKVKRRAEASVPPKQGNQKAAKAAFDRGRAYFQSRQISEGIGALHEAHRADPADVGIVQALGVAYRENNDLITAEDYTLTALALQPESAITWHVLGNIYDKKGDIPAAAASFTNAYRFSKDQDHTHRQFLRDLDLDIDVNRKRAVRLATQVIQRKLLRQTAAAREAERKASEGEAGSGPTVAGAGATTWAQPKVMALDELDKFSDEQVKAYGAVAPLDDERESRKLSRTPEAYEGKVVALGGQLDRRATSIELNFRGSLFFFVQPAIGLTFHARGVDPKSKALEFDDRFLLIGVWERGKKAGPDSRKGTWGINTYMICGAVAYEKTKEADVLCETLKKP